MTVYTEDIATALELIEEFGRDVTVQKLDTSASEGSKPWKGQGVQVVADSQATKAVFVPPSGSGFGRDLVADNNLQRIEQVCLVPQTAKDIESFNGILDSDRQLWLIQTAMTLKPGDEIIMYAFGVKR